MSIKLHNCDCEYEEIENKAKTKAKGYVLVKECSACAAKREASNIAFQAEEAKREKAIKIDKESKRLAEESLKSKGEL